MQHIRLIALACLVVVPAAMAQGPKDRVDVEVAYVKFFNVKDPNAAHKRFEGKLGEATKKITVKSKEWYPRWKRHQIAYKWIPGGTAGIKAHVLNEVKLGKLLAELAKKVKPGTDFEALAKANGLSFHKYEKANRRDLQLNKDVGSPRAMMMIWASGLAPLEKGKFTLGTVVPYETRTLGRYWPGCFDEPGNFMALYRLTKHYKAENKK